MQKLTLGSFAALALTCAASAQWKLPFLTNSPAPRQNAAMAHDSARQNTVLFGGVSAFIEQNDTWTYNGSWTLANPTKSPSNRQYVRMAFDSARAVTVLFGGMVQSGRGFAAVGGHWEWNGTDWTEVFPATGPGARGRQGMAYDSARGRMVMYGGDAGGLFGILADTWEYVGSNWTQIATANNPGGRIGAAMCYHAASGKTVLFGGADNSGVSGDTWLYDGTDWTQSTFTGATPTPRTHATMVYDPFRKVCVLFGGNEELPNPLVLADTWEFDGTSWQLMTSGTPNARYEHSMAMNTNLKRVVVFGGTTNNSGSLETDETWEYGANAGYQTFGTGCAGSLGTPVLSSTLPRLGSPWTSSASNVGGSASLWFGVSNTNWGPVSLPAGLWAIGAPGCNVLVSWDVRVPMTASGTSASFGLTLPIDGALFGAKVHNQVLILEGSKIVVSNAGTATLGY